MEESTADEQSTGGFSRRDALKRGGIVVGAAALWTTPIVQTLGQRPAAATSHPDDLTTDFCPSQGSERAPEFIFRYLGTVTATKITLTATGGTGQGSGGSTVICYGNVLPDQEVKIVREVGINDVAVSIVLSTGGTINFTIHTSCSSPLLCGARFPLATSPKWLQLVAGRDRQDRRIDCRNAAGAPNPGVLAGTVTC